MANKISIDPSSKTTGRDIFAFDVQIHWEGGKKFLAQPAPEVTLKAAAGATGTVNVEVRNHRSTRIVCKLRPSSNASGKFDVKVKQGTHIWTLPAGFEFF